MAAGGSYHGEGSHHRGFALQAEFGLCVSSGKSLEVTGITELVVPHYVPLSSDLIEEASEAVLCDSWFS